MDGLVDELNVTKFIELQDQARSPHPPADLGGDNCRWCFLPRITLPTGARICIHCDDPHKADDCRTCGKMFVQGMEKL